MLRESASLMFTTGFGFRSGDPASLHVFEEPARTVSGVEVFEELFEQIVHQWVVPRRELIGGRQLRGANAARESRIPRQQLSEAAQVKHTVSEGIGDTRSRKDIPSTFRFSTPTSRAALRVKQRQLASSLPNSPTDSLCLAQNGVCAIARE